MFDFHIIAVLTGHRGQHKQTQFDCAVHGVRSAPRFLAAQPPGTYASPAPKANEDLAKATFYTDCAKVKNGLALGVRVNAMVRCS